MTTPIDTLLAEWDEKLDCHCEDCTAKHLQRAKRLIAALKLAIEQRDEWIYAASSHAPQFKASDNAAIERVLRGSATAPSVAPEP